MVGRGAALENLCSRRWLTSCKVIEGTMLARVVCCSSVVGTGRRDCGFTTSDRCEKELAPPFGSDGHDIACAVREARWRVAGAAARLCGRLF